ncbi:MAG: cyclic-di-AMP receptor [Chloroflexota bacterium]
MKLILAIVGAEAVDPVSRTLVEQKYKVTQISSVGGFLRRGSTTLVIGIEDTQVEDALAVMRRACSPFSNTSAHSATIFVLDAAQFIQI